ncbi:MAG: prolyl oligopeptidase family serine peptidase [Candidatus Komeilibacteria bacterium]|nr:prolyl oligopeptidase family serine peptidase [Candidatus Komeilibacteria bacterium]
MDTFRIRVKKDIICEVVKPSKPSRRVIILARGMPTYPSKSELLFYFASQGYWVFCPRYRGSWESGGSFLKISPHQDILDVIDTLSPGFVDLLTGKKYQINNPAVYLIGGSFGGPAAILASQDKRVKKVVALSPVINWQVESKVERLDFMKKFVRSAFGFGYRYIDRDWDKLKTGKFYNPMAVINRLDAKKLFIIHAQDDEVVYIKPSQDFVKRLGCKFWWLKTGGHLSTSVLMELKFWNKISLFFK